METLPTFACRTYLGVDPGVGGAIVALTGDAVEFQKLDATDTDVWDWITRYIGTDCRAVIEQQTPRPTFLPHKGTSTILASTCELYGNYKALSAMLTCSMIPFDVCPPKRWQKAMEIRAREKGEDDRSWKNHLKATAQRLFPSVKITLATSDALLLAEYCRRRDRL